MALIRAAYGPHEQKNGTRGAIGAALVLVVRPLASSLISLPGLIPKEKAPAGFGGASSLRGTENARLPRVPQFLTLGRTDFKSVFCGDGHFAIACCFLATAREEESR